MSPAWGRDKKTGVCLQSSSPAHLALSFTSDPAPAVLRPPWDSSWLPRDGYKGMEALKHLKKVIGIQVSRRFSSLVANVSCIKQEAFSFMWIHKIPSGKYEEVYIATFSYVSLRKVNALMFHCYYFQILIFVGNVQVSKINSSPRKILFQKQTKNRFPDYPKQL